MLWPNRCAPGYVDMHRPALLLPLKLRGRWTLSVVTPSQKRHAHPASSSERPNAVGMRGSACPSIRYCSNAYASFAPSGQAASTLSGDGSGGVSGEGGIRGVPTGGLGGSGNAGGGKGAADKAFESILVG